MRRYATSVGVGLSTSPLASGIVFLLTVLAVASLTCCVTGYRPRDYVTLSPSTVVEINSRIISVEQLAYDFKPLLFLKPGDISPLAIEMWWEAVDAGHSIVLVYHPVWQDEHHPVPLLDYIYSVYRSIVYGIPLRDIEYIQINVAYSDGRILRVRFEGSSSPSYYSWFINHTQVVVNRKMDNYIKIETPVGGTPNVEAIKLNDPHLHLGIVSWSHQFTLLCDDSSEGYTLPVMMPLVHLTDGNYTKFKLARRSQGDFVTKDSIIGRVAKSTVGVLVLGVPYLISRFFCSDARSKN